MGARKKAKEHPPTPPPKYKQPPNIGNFQTTPKYEQKQPLELILETQIKATVGYIWGGVCRCYDRSSYAISIVHLPSRRTCFRRLARFWPGAKCISLGASFRALGGWGDTKAPVDLNRGGVTWPEASDWSCVTGILERVYFLPLLGQTLRGNPHGARRPAEGRGGINPACWRRVFAAADSLIAPG